MSLLPYLDSEGKLVDGTYFRLLPFCLKQCATGKCKEFYANLQTAKPGSYCCPYGLSAYVYDSSTTKMIFSGMKIKGVYDKKKAKVTESQTNIYSPVIDSINCYAIAKELALISQEQLSLESKLNSIRDILHETRTLNGQIKNSIDLLWETNLSEDDIDYETMLETLKSAHVSSLMISNRFSFFDSVLNPELSVGTTYPAVVFKKFDKIRRILKGYMRKNVRISLETPVQSDYRFAVYPTFETLLFIILENAIKYSPEGNTVHVLFEECDERLDVRITSTGPYCTENEIVQLSEKGFRAENAVMATQSGQGFGLHFAKEICALHEINISFKSAYSHKDRGIKYGIFTVHLQFDNKQYN